MTTSPAISESSSGPVVLPAPITQLLRLEGLAIGAITAVFYARTGASWWLFAALWLAPDLSILGYLLGSCRGSRVYNAAHTYTLPATLALCGLVLRAPALLPFALIWANHIAIDRLMGYGLKFSNGFDWTHLGVRKRRFSSGQTAATNQSV
ncbi:DUF4260 family protein [Acidobacteria bacterium AB60]|nr:DUF4260 family protein [Acidobacteria bacterium AB60]